MDDTQFLEDLNISELLECARLQGLGVLSRGIPRDRLLRIVSGEEEPTKSDLCGSLVIRKRTEKFISNYHSRATLPVSVGGKPCNGKCSSFGCPTAVALNCSAAMTR